MIPVAMAIDATVSARLPQRTGALASGQDADFLLVLSDTPCAIAGNGRGRSGEIPLEQQDGGAAGQSPAAVEVDPTLEGRSPESVPSPDTTLERVAGGVTVVAPLAFTAAGPAPGGVASTTVVPPNLPHALAAPTVDSSGPLGRADRLQMSGGAATPLLHPEISVATASVPLPTAAEDAVFPTKGFGTFPAPSPRRISDARTETASEPTMIAVPQSNTTPSFRPGSDDVPVRHGPPVRSPASDVVSQLPSAGPEAAVTDGPAPARASTDPKMSEPAQAVAPQSRLARQVNCGVLPPLPTTAPPPGSPPLALAAVVDAPVGAQDRLPVPAARLAASSADDDLRTNGMPLAPIRVSATDAATDTPVFPSANPDWSSLPGRDAGGLSIIPVSGPDPTRDMIPVRRASPGVPALADGSGLHSDLLVCRAKAAYRGSVAANDQARHAAPRSTPSGLAAATGRKATEGPIRPNRGDLAEPDAPRTHAGAPAATFPAGNATPPTSPPPAQVTTPEPAPGATWTSFSTSTPLWPEEMLREADRRDAPPDPADQVPQVRQTRPTAPTIAGAANPSTDTGRAAQGGNTLHVLTGSPDRPTDMTLILASHPASIRPVGPVSEIGPMMTAAALNPFATPLEPILVTAAPRPDLADPPPQPLVPATATATAARSRPTPAFAASPADAPGPAVHHLSDPAADPFAVPEPAAGTGAAVPLAHSLVGGGTHPFSPPTVTIVQLAPLAITLAADAGSGTVDLVLAPEELGAMQMQIATEGEALRIVITAERPETLDLLRRHADLLLSDLRQAGFGGATLGFAQGGAGEGRAPALPPSQPLPVAADTARTEQPTLPFGGYDGGNAPLDLRL